MTNNYDIEIKNLSFKIEDKLLLDNVSMAIEKNEFVGLIGPNGSGKSTLLKNIYKEYKSSSNIWIQSKPLENFKYRDLSKLMSVVTQESSIAFDFSVDEMMKMSRIPYKDILKNKEKDDESICVDALKKVGMQNMRYRSFLSLSGGEKQRVLLAMAFAQKTDIIILDEPTNHLDISYQMMILSMLKNEKNMTKFTSFHDMNLAVQFCDRIIVLDEGKVVENGKPTQVITKELMRDVFSVDVDIIKADQNVPWHIVYKGHRV